jgi:hypothetical protein
MRNGSNLIPVNSQICCDKLSHHHISQGKMKLSGWSQRRSGGSAYLGAAVGVCSLWRGAAAGIFIGGLIGGGGGYFVGFFRWESVYDSASKNEINMRAKEFVEKMDAVKFTLPDNAKEDYGDDFIDNLLNSYKFKPKSSDGAADSVLDLVNRFDGSGVEIGMLSFSKKTDEDAAYFYFGNFEVDDMVIEKKSGQVLLKENGKNHILYACASSGSAFLDAVYAAASFLAAVPLGEDVSEQPDVCNVSAKCAAHAGGEAYSAFYKMFIGCYKRD